MRPHITFALAFLMLGCVSWLKAAEPSPQFDGIAAIRKSLDEKRWQQVVEQAQAQPGGGAQVDYYYGLALAQLGRWDEARAAFRRASDLDAVPQGIPTRFNDIVREVARQSGALLVDADARFEQESPHGIVGGALFADFVHPNIRGHQLIAAAIADTLRAAGVPAPAERWRSGAYVDPDPATLLAADPKLRIREHLVRALACDLALRVPCALAELDAVLAIEPQHPQALQLRYHLVHPPAAGS